MPETGITTIIEEARRYIADHYAEHFGDRFPFHNHQHALRVYKSINTLADAEGMSEEEKEILSLAALFHDAGYYKGSEGHEERSAELAEIFLRKKNYPEGKIASVKDCIKATIPARPPQSKLHQLMQDADMSHLGRKDYIQLLNKLKQEWEAAGSKFRKSGWWNMNAEFIKTHNFHTQAARDIYGEQKQVNYANIKSVADLYSGEKRQKKKKNPKDLDPSSASGSSLIGLMDNRSAQMMFKTALRNHIDLTSIADNKANIMLSINALIITITIPLVANIGNLTLNLIIPIGFLMMTSIISIIFAALVTRPIKMGGYTHISSVSEGKSNLFFFGNFYKMDIREYEEGMASVLKSEKLLNAAIFRDLYFLGSALGTKYRRLRICYMVFIIGMVATSLSFLLSEIII